MNRAPPFSVMFERLCQMLGTEESVFERWEGNPKHANKARRVKGCRMTPGLALEVQRLGGRDGTRIQVMTHTGEGTGGNNFLYSRGAGDFARQVWAIQAGLRIAEQLGTLGKVKP